jgi:hypothetical protein
MTHAINSYGVDPIRELFNKVDQRADGWNERRDVILDGRLMRDELRWIATELNQILMRQSGPSSYFAALIEIAMGLRTGKLGKIGAAEQVEALAGRMNADSSRSGPQTPITRSAASFPSDYRKVLEASNLPIEVAVAIADALDKRSGPNERLIVALESCASKLNQLGAVFSSPNFTDRYGDGPVCVALSKHARSVLDEVRQSATNNGGNHGT